MTNGLIFKSSLYAAFQTDVNLKRRKHRPFSRPEGRYSAACRQGGAVAQVRVKSQPLAVEIFDQSARYGRALNLAQVVNVQLIVHFKLNPL